MSLTYVPVTGTFVYRGAGGTIPAAGEQVFFRPRSPAIVDGAVITLPKVLAATLNESGALPAGFTLPTAGDVVYYDVTERFVGARGAYTIAVHPTDTAIDLATAPPAVPPEELITIEQAAVIQAAYTARDAAQAAAQDAADSAVAAAASIQQNTTSSYTDDFGFFNSLSVARSSDFDDGGIRKVTGAGMRFQQRFSPTEQYDVEVAGYGFSTYKFNPSQVGTAYTTNGCSFTGNQISFQSFSISKDTKGFLGSRYLTLQPEAMDDPTTGYGQKIVKVQNKAGTLALKSDITPQLKAVATLTSSGGAASINLSTGTQVWNISLTENTAISFTNLPASGFVAEARVRITQNASAAKTCVFNGTTKKTAGGAAWTVSSVLGSVEYVDIQIDSAGNIVQFPRGLLA